MKLHIDRQPQPPRAVVRRCLNPERCLGEHFDPCEPCWRDYAVMRPTRMQIRGVFLCQDCQERDR